jgi:two-component system NtrC family sensor kinase
MKAFICFLFTLHLVFSSWGQPTKAIMIKESNRQLVTSPIFHLKDDSGRLTVNDIASSGALQELVPGVPNFGIQKGNFWFRLTIANESDEPLFLEIAHPVLNEVHFFDLDEYGDLPIVDGQNIPFSKKGTDFTNIVFDLNLLPGTTKTYYIELNSKTQIQFPLFIGSKSSLKKANRTIQLFSFLFIGVMGAMLLYNLAIYFIVRDNSYLYYVLFVCVIAIVQLVPKGVAHQFLWPEHSEIANASMFLSPALSGYASILFFISFLKVKLYLPKLYKLLYVFVGVYAIGLLLFLFNKYDLSYGVLDTSSLLVSILMLIGAVMIYRKGNKSALFFLIAWSIFLSGVVIFVLKEVGILPHNNITNYTMFVGAGIETLLLSIGLANRISELKKEKEQAQLKELEALQKTEKLIREQNVLLDQKVKERTAKLDKALESVKKAQNKLVETEKMASVGQLTAGIAHEINNPVNYITSSVGALERDLNDILTIVEKHDGITEQNVLDKLEEIERLKKEMEFDYLKQEEIPMLIQGIKEGTRRTAEIVASLRIFSSSDKDKKIKTDITKGIDSSLILLSNKLGDISVITDYEISEPIYCYPGKLNQAFMNIIANSIDAIKERQQTTQFDGKIKISASKEKDRITVAVTDNGIGMEANVLKNVFDPFYTSKEVGSGMGLGMALTYNYIKLHDGDIAIKSTVNQGTTITITFISRVN